VLNKDVFPEGSPFDFFMVPIDSKFISDYLDKSVPYLRAGDLIYVLVAKKALLSSNKQG